MSRRIERRASRLNYPTVVFTDYLSMLKIDGKWMIVNKTFHARRRN